MGFAVWGVSAHLLFAEGQTTVLLAGGLAVSIITGLVSYGLLSHVLNRNELTGVLKMFRGNPR